LVRVDAVGLCFSDIKLIRLGGEHPKLYGRNLATDPTRLGHETAVTVMTVGANLADRFHPGQRLAIQPDIYVNGRSTAYGYTIPGGLIGYHLIGPEVLAADDGAYVVPVDDRLGYAETALTEPWACVEAAYSQRRRLVPMRGGRTWVVGHPDDHRSYDFGTTLKDAREIVVSGLRDDLVAALRSSAPQARRASTGGRGCLRRRGRSDGADASRARAQNAERPVDTDRCRPRRRPPRHRARPLGASCAGVRSEAPDDHEAERRRPCHRRGDRNAQPRRRRHHRDRADRRRGDPGGATLGWGRNARAVRGPACRDSREPRSLARLPSWRSVHGHVGVTHRGSGARRPQDTRGPAVAGSCPRG